MIDNQMARTTEKITGDTIKDLERPDKGYRIIWDGGDGGVKGFGVRITAAGAVSFIFNYRTKGGLLRRLTIGSPPSWSIEAARKEARALATDVDRGGDPLATWNAKRKAPVSRTSLTFTSSDIYQRSDRRRPRTTGRRLRSCCCRNSESARSPTLPLTRSTSSTSG